MAHGFAEIIFLKLGGSLITHKNQPRSVNEANLSYIAGEISRAFVRIQKDQPGLRLLLGHGSGSFGHVTAQKYGTRQGVNSAAGWVGFAKVWQAAASLNHLVIDALHAAGLPAVAFPASSSLIAHNHDVAQWEVGPIRRALQVGLLPVVYGDVVFDQELGGTIFSTEDLFVYLAAHLHPKRLLLAGIEPGVWEDYPTCQRLIHHITPQNFNQINHHLAGSASVDVTGGMADKVGTMLDLVRQHPRLKVHIFSGVQPDEIFNAILGSSPGTLISCP